LPSERTVSRLDGVFAPKGIDEKEGVAVLAKLEGFTVLAFWDRSADERFASNSAFLSRQSQTFDEILAEAKQKFPQIFDRFDFEITEYKGSGHQTAN
jgi:hypothetical protein